MITLATLSQATAQQVFDQVVQNLISQGVRSEAFNEEGKSIGCSYRTMLSDGNTLKCAAGWLMDDSEYKVDMDQEPGGTDWHSLVERGLVPKKHQDLISELQYIHDTVQPKDWEKAFEVYGFNNGLYYNSIPSQPKTKTHVKNERPVHQHDE